MQIELTIQLTSRRIEIGREIQRQPCRYRTVLRHYQKKAMADNEAFADYVNTVATTLRNTPMPMIQADTSAAEVRHQLEQWVKKVVDQNLQSLQKARRAAFQAVDTADEMRQLAGAAHKVPDPLPRLGVFTIVFPPTLTHLSALSAKRSESYKRA